LTWVKLRCCFFVLFSFYLFFWFYCWESSLPWTAQSWQCFRKISVGEGCFLDISNPCISETVGHIKTNMEVLGRLRPHFLLVLPSFSSLHKKEVGRVLLRGKFWRKKNSAFLEAYGLDDKYSFTVRKAVRRRKLWCMFKKISYGF